MSAPTVTSADAPTTAAPGAAASSMTPAQFDFLCDLVRRESAIVLEPGKEYLVESRLAPIARREGLASVGALVDALSSHAGPGLRASVLDAMTTNETSFFRDVHPWQTLRETILPELIAARRSTRRLSIWCGACSSGQEPFTLAMVLAETFPEVIDTWDVRILSTDISPSMLDRCRAGRFSQLEVNRGLPASSLQRWFRRDGTQWAIDDRLRALLDVRPGNLAVPSSMSGISRLDLVLIRNVLIYFDAETRRRIVDDARTRMQRDAVLMLGSSEISIGADQGFERHQSGKTVFFRPA